MGTSVMTGSPHVLKLGLVEKSRAQNFTDLSAPEYCGEYMWPLEKFVPLKISLRANQWNDNCQYSQVEISLFS